MKWKPKANTIKQKAHFQHTQKENENTAALALACSKPTVCASQRKAQRDSSVSLVFQGGQFPIVFRVFSTDFQEVLGFFPFLSSNVHGWECCTCSLVLILLWWDVVKSASVLILWAWLILWRKSVRQVIVAWKKNIKQRLNSGGFHLSWLQGEENGMKGNLRSLPKGWKPINKGSSCEIVHPTKKGLSRLMAFLKWCSLLDDIPPLSTTKPLLPASTSGLLFKSFMSRLDSWKWQFKSADLFGGPKFFVFRAEKISSPPNKVKNQWKSFASLVRRKLNRKNNST